MKSLLKEKRVKTAQAFSWLGAGAFVIGTRANFGGAHEYMMVMNIRTPEGRLALVLQILILS